MKQTSLKLILAAALIATGACSKKPPKDLPPPPPTTGAQTDGGGFNDGGNTGAGIVPGSQEDFRQQAGSDTVLFGTDMYDIDGEARAILDRQSAWLKKYPNARITVEGHADERGTREYNLALGDRRANSAKNYLASAGIAASRISTISYGKERPAVPGSDEAAWAQNRRAVTVVLSQ